MSDFPSQLTLTARRPFAVVRCTSPNTDWSIIAGPYPVDGPPPPPGNPFYLTPPWPSDKGSAAVLILTGDREGWFTDRTVSLVFAFGGQNIGQEVRVLLRARGYGVRGLSGTTIARRAAAPARCAPPCGCSGASDGDCSCAR